MEGFFGVGPLELLVIAVLALVFIGPQRLPGVIQQVMRAWRELRDQMDNVRAELAPQLDELRKEAEGLSNELTSAGRDMTASMNSVVADANEAARAAQLPPSSHSSRSPTADVVGASTSGGTEAARPPLPEHMPLLSPPVVVHTNGASGNGVHHDDDREAGFDYRPA